MNLYINNGLIVDPENNLEALGDLVIEEGIIKEISLYKNGRKPVSVGTDAAGSAAIGRAETCSDMLDGSICIDAKGNWVVPGLIDLHVHLREPGFEYKEEIESGCRSAAKGGFTTICCMPNTNPVIDCSYVVLMIDSKTKEGNGVRVQCIGAVTKGQEGRELADYEGMLRTGSNYTGSEGGGIFGISGGGICGISEDGKTVRDADLMLSAMKKAKELGLTVFSHAEPETEIVKRDIALAEAAGCRLHFCHISEKSSIELIRNAKKRGVPVTAETAPHYFTLTSSEVNGDTNKKMNPPLRQKEDVEAVKQALRDGTIDVIATDHAPHHESEKSLPFDEAPNGVTGLETSFSVSYTELVLTGVLTPLELMAKMSSNPAEILGVNRGRLWAGRPADLTIIDVESEYEVRPGTFESKGKNSPFIGRKVFGQVEYTIVGGDIIWKAGKRALDNNKMNGQEAQK